MTGQEQIYSGSGAGLYPGAGVGVFAVGIKRSVIMPPRVLMDSLSERKMEVFYV